MNDRRNPIIIPGTDPSAIDLAANQLRSGALVVFPTDTVYGIGASIDHPDAVSRLFVAKGRPLDRAIPVLVSSFEQIQRLSKNLDPRVERLTRHFWPGALTVVVPAADWVPIEVVRDTGRVGVRMPDHSFARALIERAGGALATTSANLSGEREARSAGDLEPDLIRGVDLVVDGGTTPGGIPSTVILVEGDRIRILRDGAIPASEIPRDLSSS